LNFVVAAAPATAGSVDAEPWYLYAGFIAFVIAMLLVDLKFFHTEGREPTAGQSGAWVGVWVGLALVFGVIVFWWKGTDSGAEYFAGYLIEYSLSVDNMFVFVIIFSYFRVPFAYQHQVLFYGILGAMIFRGIFIALGVALITRFDWIILVFGAFLIYTAYRIVKGHGQEIHPENNPVLKFAKRRLRTTSSFHGQSLFVIEDAKRVATPLFIALLFIEMVDIVFALDSIPAIFGITEDPFIVLTSNVFAILGLRALYFLLAGSIDRFHLLNYGLGIVLAFVGTKMLLTGVSCSGESVFCEVAEGNLTGHVELPIWFSLPFIVIVLAATVFLSLKIPPKKKMPSREAFPSPDEVPQVEEAKG
jgi:tellurite resistance protein TerC